MQAFLIGLGAILAYGVLHSLLAALSVKERARRWLGAYRYEAVYRLLFNIVATVTLVPVLWLGATHPGPVLWRVSSPYSVILIGLQLVGLTGLLISLAQIDLLRFMGISQLAAGLRGDPLPLPDEPLTTGGVYGLVRHPLYFFSLLALWPTPIMTSGLLGLLTGITLYFAVGSRLEENKLRLAFGEAYRDYQQQVPWMIPGLHLSRRHDPPA